MSNYSLWTSLGSSLSLVDFSKRGCNIEIIACHFVFIISSPQGLLGNPRGMNPTDIRQMFGIF